MKKIMASLAVVAVAALYGFWPATGDAGSARHLDAMNQGGGVCTYEGQDYGEGDKVCIQSQEMQCTTEGFVATGEGC